MKFEFHNLGHGFLVEFYYSKQKITTQITTQETIQETTVETTVETLIQLLKQNPRMTQSELMNKLSLSRRGVEWHIKRLKQKGILTRKGSTRGEGGYWDVNNN